jgi:hypothetical protein
MHVRTASAYTLPLACSPTYCEKTPTTIVPPVEFTAIASRAVSCSLTFLISIRDRANRPVPRGNVLSTFFFEIFQLIRAQYPYIEQASQN